MNTATGVARDRRAAGIAFALVSAASFGVMAILIRIAYDAGAEPAAILFVRFAVAAVILSAIRRARRVGAAARGQRMGVAVLGAIYVGQSLCYFTALRYAPAALVALLLYLNPAIVAVAASVLFGARLGRTRVAALIIALVGMVATVGAAWPADPLGIALAIGAAVIYATYILVGSRVSTGPGPLASSEIVTASAALIFGVVVLASGPSFPATADGWAAALGIALVSTVVAIVTFFAAMERLGPSDAATISTIEPAVTVVLAALVLHERVTALQVFGGSLILAAVVLLSRVRAPVDAGPDPSGHP